MKLRLIIGVVVVAFVGLSLSANYIAQRVIAEQLPVVLSRAEGQPVTIDNVSANIWRLRARAEKLVYGPEGHEAIVANNLVIYLDFARLLRGEVYINTATADLLQIRPSLWLQAADAGSAAGPTLSSSERADVMAAFQRWIPDELEVEKLEVFRGDTRVFVAEQQRWINRGPYKRQIFWSDTRAGKVYHYDLEVNSLLDVYHQKTANVQLTVSSEAVAELLTAKFETRIVEDRFRTNVSLKTASIEGVWHLDADAFFELPAESRLEIAHVEPLKVEDALALFDFTIGRDESVEPVDFLKSPLPDWDLPAHTVHTKITQLDVDDEAIRNFAADIKMQPAAGAAGGGIQVTSLVAQLPRGDLQGSLSATIGKTWQMVIDAQIDARSPGQGLASQFVDSNWHWRAGQGHFETQGQTLAGLLDNARGDVDLQGVYVAAKELPFTLKAKLDERRGRLGTDIMELRVGNSIVKGTAWIEEGRRGLFLRLNSDRFDVTELLSTRAGANAVAAAETPVAASEKPVAAGEKPVAAGEKPVAAVVEPVASAETLAGIEIPDWGWWKSDMKIDARLAGAELVLPGLVAKNVDVEFLRAVEGDKLHLTFAPGGTGKVDLAAATKRREDDRDLSLNLTVTDVDPATFSLEPSPAQVNGSLQLQGSGNSFRNLVADLSGPSELRFESGITGRPIDLKATSRLLITQERIVGVDLGGLALTVADEPEITGDLALDITIPRIAGSLQTGEFDVDKLLQALPAGEDDDEGLAATLNALPRVDLALVADELKILQQPLRDFAVKLLATDHELSVGGLTLSSEIGSVKADGKLRLRGEQIDFALEGELGGVALTPLLKSRNLPKLSGPLDGSIKVQTTGKDWLDLSANLSGHLRLQDPSQGTSGEDRLNVDVQLRQGPDGVVGDIKSLQWGRSDLRGQVSFKRGEPPMLTADLESDFMDVDYIQARLADAPSSAGVLEKAITVAHGKAPAKDKSDTDEQEKAGSVAGTSAQKKPQGAAATDTTDTPDTATTQAASDDPPGSVAEFANSSVRLLTGVLSSPFSLFRRETADGSKRFFDPVPYRIDVMKMLDADVAFRVKQVTGEFGAAFRLALDANLKAGNLNMLVSADDINSAPVNLVFNFDSRQEPPQTRLNTTLSGYYPGGNKKAAPRSAYFDLHAEGTSQAEWMASMNGQLFVQGGRGEADLRVLGLGFFTGDLLGRVAGSLLPNQERVPTLNCGLAYGVIEDGVLSSPYGMVLQSPHANILIRATVDMKKETILAQFDSRSRTGAGISVGNVFSNTVRLRGPLLDPRLVPNTTGLAWRGWAALMTGGLSLIGESVAKRMLGARNPCSHLAEQIQEKVCEPAKTPAASSHLVCPSAQGVNPVAAADAPTG